MTMSSEVDEELPSSCHCGSQPKEVRVEGEELVASWETQYHPPGHTEPSHSLDTQNHHTPMHAHKMDLKGDTQNSRALGIHQRCDLLSVRLLSRR